jgi:5-formyltetrahydrofolate cyclo-ligase
MIPLEEKRKQLLRRQALDRRERLGPEQIETLSARIAAQVQALPAWQQARVILGYCAFNSEVRTDQLLAAALAAGKRVGLPRVNRARHTLDLYCVPALNGHYLARSPWGILEPVAERCVPLRIEEVDLVLVPGVAFDLCGGRIGYGGGYYDRLLRCLPPERQGQVVGLAFECQLVREIPVSFFDFRVPLIVTERRVIRTGQVGCALGNAAGAQASPNGGERS